MLRSFVFVKLKSNFYLDTCAPLELEGWLYLKYCSIVWGGEGF